MAGRGPEDPEKPALTLLRFLAFSAPVVFLVNFIFAYADISPDWSKTLPYAGGGTVVTLLLMALCWVLSGNGPRKG